ncbi:MAG: hypothetical protein AB7N76_01635 [Planctomycetota bacterium]
MGAQRIDLPRAGACACGRAEDESHRAPGPSELAFRPGQLALRRRDDAVVEVRALAGGGCFLGDGSWLCVCELEDPLREGRLRDIRRAAADAARERAIARGDFARAFPALRARRRSCATRWLPASGWLLAALEAGALLLLLLR